MSLNENQLKKLGYQLLLPDKNKRLNMKGTFVEGIQIKGLYYSQITQQIKLRDSVYRRIFRIRIPKENEKVGMAEK